MLARKLRELTRCRLLILVAVDEKKSDKPKRRSIVVDPPGEASLLESPSLAKLLDESFLTNEATLERIPEPCLILPLRKVGGYRGSALAFDLEDESLIPSILEIQAQLESAICAYLENALILDCYRRSMRRLDSILEGTDAGTWEWDPGSDEIRINARYAQMLGYSLSELTPYTREKLRSHMHPGDLEATLELMRAHIEGKSDRYEAEFRMHRKDGSFAWVMAKGKVAERDEAGRPLLVSGTHLDITASKEDQEKIRHLANHDELTGLPSLRLAKDRLGMAIGLARRHEDIAAIMFVDLDGFKQVNDSLGHDAGDDMLRYVARQLEGCVREVDTVARLGGDEFIVIAGGLSSRSDATVIARAIVALVSQPTMLRGVNSRVSASVGIALYPADEQDPDRLIRLADEAMYEVKKNGKNGFAFARQVP